MNEFEPVPTSDRDDSASRWRDDTDTFGRVYDVLLGITERTPYTRIAELADCSPNAAKKHLDRLIGMGIARTHSGSQPASYARDDGYLEWQEARRIARELTVEEIIERVGELEIERDRFEERFDATDPSAVSAFDGEDHETVHERMAAVAEWQGVVRDVRLYELARRLVQNDGHLVSA